MTDAVAWLESVEAAPEAERLVAVAFVAGRTLVLDPGELNAAIRRSQLLLATGGDPRRALDLDGRAVTALAADLDDAARRAALHEGLALLADDVASTPRLAEAVGRLRADGDLAWRAFAAAQLAGSLDDED